MSDQDKNFQVVNICVVIVVLCLGGYFLFNYDGYHNSRPQSRVKAVTGNLRQMATAASRYMLDKGVTQAAYTDIVGTTPDKYIRTITGVAGEDYRAITVHQRDTQISMTSAGFGTVTYNL